MVTEFFRFISGWASIISKDDRDGLEFWVGGSGKGGKTDGCKGNKTRRDKARAGHYRHELKYNITYWQYLQLRSRFRQVMKTDPHTESDGTYQIRSIYFDNVQDKALREKVNGVAKREKFRIRYYNDNFTYIILEKKIKDNNLCMKVSAGLKDAECRMLLAGNLEWMRNHPSSLVQELYGKMKYQQLRPRVLVSYTREPYIYAAGNVRITFDWNVRTTMYHQKFLEEKVYDVEAVQCPGEMIMEVKYDAFLPRVIQDLIQMDGVRQQSFSKYGACRNYG